ncbi:hypothetical protein GV827_02615 [Sulfitobacter sp. JBTF-M27]|uniref:Uncharacterized protein n=1 Tax=Sulfitobacter sediminilitoris TaxID=2698830 RepID=A0A6P0CAB5_9RHOB|nr:hypothetical protein [Sulfitobacter sediminilitoris]NEK21294.1 hypothetical protein [Sulfitobacter sediminilitoris]
MLQAVTGGGGEPSFARQRLITHGGLPLSQLFFKQFDPDQGGEDLLNLG